MSALLQVEHLSVRFQGRAGFVQAVDDVSFRLQRGETLGLVGESGSGKSMTANAVLGLVQPPGEIHAGRMLFKGEDLFALSPRQLRALRGDRIAMVFQDPMTALNPVLRIGTQITETLHAHQRMSSRAAREQASAALGRVGIPDPDAALLAWPHQFSGGMRQRVAIAIAMINRPELLICDEPTTALDVTTQAQILGQMQALCREAGTTLLWISHDLAVVASIADRVCVMQSGRIVETGSTAEVLESPRHPYVKRLLDAVPARHAPGARLSAREGEVDA